MKLRRVDTKNFLLAIKITLAVKAATYSVI